MSKKRKTENKRKEVLANQIETTNVDLITIEWNPLLKSPLTVLHIYLLVCFFITVILSMSRGIPVMHLRLVSTPPKTPIPHIYWLHMEYLIQQGGEWKCLS